MSRALGRAIGSVVSPIVEFVDVDGVIQRVDVDALLDNIDINRHLDRVDINRLLDRIDMDAVLARVDVQELVNRSDLPRIISQSSAGVFSNLMDAVRLQLAILDQVMHSLFWCNCTRCENFCRELPPPPGIEEDPAPTYPKKPSLRAVVLQGRCAGIVSRTSAWLVDSLISALIFGLGILIFETIYGVLADKDFTTDKSSFLFAMIYYAWSVVYNFLCIVLTGRTIGRALIGLLIVSSNGKKLGVISAFLFSLLTPWMILIFVGFVLSFLRRDRRMIHDWLSCVTCVYSWDAKAARLRDEDLMNEDQAQPVFMSELRVEETTDRVRKTAVSSRLPPA